MMSGGFQVTRHRQIPVSFNFAKTLLTNWIGGKSLNFLCHGRRILTLFTKLAMDIETLNVEVEAGPNPPHISCINSLAELMAAATLHHVMRQEIRNSQLDFLG